MRFTNESSTFRGARGLRDEGLARSALAQPQAGFGGETLYPALAEKAAALGYSLVSNHPFVDGNKRVGHAAMEVFRTLNGFELLASVDEAERVILQLAASNCSRAEFTDWVLSRLIPLNNKS